MCQRNRVLVFEFAVGILSSPDLAIFTYVYYCFFQRAVYAVEVALESLVQLWQFFGSFGSFLKLVHASVCVVDEEHDLLAEVVELCLFSQLSNTSHQSLMSYHLFPQFEGAHEMEG